MLFRHDIEPSCSYCRYGTDIGRGEVMCVKRGIMSVYGNCGGFRYEPVKREPEYARSLNLTNLNEQDFAI